MEKISRDYQPEQKEDIADEYRVPLVDALRDASQASEIWPDFAEDLRPQIERHAEDANKIIEYLDDLERGEATLAQKQRFYEATCHLLDNPEQERIALFLPFESFPAADEDSYEAQRFRESYLSAWGNLLFVQDVRANFNDGDVLEVDARPGDPERVIKAAHLMPWLVESGMLNAEDIISLAQDGRDELLTRSILDTTELLLDKKLLTRTQYATLEKIKADLPEKSSPLPPKYISIARHAWLAQKSSWTRPVQPSDQSRLDQPLGERLAGLGNELADVEQIASNLDLTQTYGVVWLGGSRLKGYSQNDSDLDLYIPVKTHIYEIGQISAIPVSDIMQELAEHAHEVFDMAWIGEAARVQELQREIAPKYFLENNLQIRKWVTERLEQDLLEYRLLHKGYPRLYPDTNPEYKKYSSMDGQSAFYESGYRFIASKIFANSIFVPCIL